MIKTDNPAGRLYAILNEAKNMSHNISTRDVWLKVFKIESKSQTELFRTLTSLQELMDEIKEQLNEADDINKDLYIKYLPNIERVIRVTNLDTSWNSYRESLSDVAMYNLAHCAEILSSRYGESTIEEQELFKLKDEIDTLYEIVRTGSLNKELKIIILDQLEIIRRAIHEYRIRGAKGLHKALR
ncbi:MAG: hypothetical protein HZB79_03860 [Deltaproteobacteria bacterium]|nr:hypothetical protein [Deltaproteobacteria bacterium]